MLDRFVGLGSLVAAIGLAFVGEGPRESASSPMAWEGPAPHVRLEGRLEGEAISVRLEGEDALRVARAACKPRESEWRHAAGARGLRFEVPTYEGRRRFELVLVGDRLVRGQDGEHLSVVPLRASGHGDQSSVAFALEWRRDDEADAHGRASESGAFHRVRFVNGDTRDATLEGHLASRWSDGDFVDLSFTIPCSR